MGKTTKPAKSSTRAAIKSKQSRELDATTLERVRIYCAEEWKRERGVPWMSWLQMHSQPTLRELMPPGFHASFADVDGRARALVRRLQEVNRAAIRLVEEVREGVAKWKTEVEGYDDRPDLGWNDFPGPRIAGVASRDVDDLRKWVAFLETSQQGSASDVVKRLTAAAAPNRGRKPKEKRDLVARLALVQVGHRDDGRGGYVVYDDPPLPARTAALMSILEGTVPAIKKGESNAEILATETAAMRAAMKRQHEWATEAKARLLDEMRSERVPRRGGPANVRPEGRPDPFTELVKMAAWGVGIVSADYPNLWIPWLLRRWVESGSGRARPPTQKEFREAAVAMAAKRRGDEK